MKEVAEVSPSALWCGYFLRGSVARYGAHCLALTRQSAAWIKRYSESLAVESDAYQHYIGLDTFFYHITQNNKLKLHGGEPPIAVASQSFSPADAPVQGPQLD
jgi:hypothetical protein